MNPQGAPRCQSVRGGVCLLLPFALLLLRLSPVQHPVVSLFFHEVMPMSPQGAPRCQSVRGGVCLLLLTPLCPPPLTSLASAALRAPPAPLQRRRPCALPRLCVDAHRDLLQHVIHAECYESPRPAKVLRQREVLLLYARHIMRALWKKMCRANPNNHRLKGIEKPQLCQAASQHQSR